MIATVTPSAAPQALARELWVSFACLLRSHAAMQSIAQPSLSLRVVRSSPLTVELLSMRGRLIITGPDAEGRCAVEFRPEAATSGDEYFSLVFTGQGLVQLDSLDAPLDFEAAVELLLRKVHG